ncbi:hypothetical protein J2S46_004178 [Kitasatospora herbaricolor]|nr:hypothetical protein [Kitasatospora herbaricolor]
MLYTLGIWSHLGFVTGGKQHGIGDSWYHFAVALHLLGTLYLCAVIVRDILLPDRDPVRWDGSDDPSGGVLDGAPDVFVLGSARRLKEEATYAAYAPAGAEGWLNVPEAVEPTAVEPGAEPGVGGAGADLPGLPRPAAGH